MGGTRCNQVQARARLRASEYFATLEQPMKLTINTKTIIVLIFHLAVIILLASFATFYVQNLATGSKNIVKDNLRSIRYCAFMQQSLFELRKDVNQLSFRTEFENNLLAELNNITEIGEK